MIDVVTAERLLGRHVIGAAQGHALLRQLAIFGRLRLLDLGDTEVEQLGLLSAELITRDQDVVGLDVPVNDALVVCRAQAVG